MNLLDKFREENPVYKDVDDNTLAPALYKKFYADKMSSQEFAEKITTPYERKETPEFAPSMREARYLNLSQGFTGGTADEISSAAAGGISALTGGDFKSAYEKSMEDQAKALAAAKEKYPVTSGASELAGALGTGLAGGAKLAGTKALQNTGVLGAAGIGGLSGGAYEYATGYGGIGERFKGVPAAAALGAGLGGGANLVGRGVSNYLTQRAQKILGQAPQKTDDMVGLSGKSIQETPDLKMLAEQGESVAMPKGAKTGDVNLMRLEEAARQGNLGDDLQRQIQQLDERSRQEVMDRVQSLVGRTTDESPEILSGGLGKVQDVFKKRKALQNKLMTARDDALAKTQVYKDYTKGTLGEQIKDLTQTPSFQVALPKDANAPLREEIKSLNRILNKKGDVNFSFLQAWRSGLNDLRKAGDQKAVLAGDLARTYDDWLENITKDAIKAGDEDIAEKVFKANREYTKYKNLYGTNKRKGQNSVIEDILNKEELTPEQAVNTLFGKSVQGNQYTAQNLKRILKGIEDDALKNTVQAELRGGLVKRAYENATSSGQLSLGKLKNELIKLRRSEPYKMNLASKESDEVIDGLISDLGKIVDAQSRRDVYSPSAPAVIRGLSYMFDKAGVAMPSARAVSSGLENIGKAGKKRPDAKQVQKAIQEIMNQADSAMQNKGRIYGAPAAGVMGGVGGEQPALQTGQQTFYKDEQGFYTLDEQGNKVRE